MPTAQDTQRADRILIVEDDPDDVFLLERALGQAQRRLCRRIDCRHVTNGLDAIFFISQQEMRDDLPDVVVLDLNMPRLDGLGFLRSLRNSLHLKDLQVVVLTTSAQPSIRDQALQAGANRVFVKPDAPEGFLDIAVEIIENR